MKTDVVSLRSKHDLHVPKGNVRPGLRCGINFRTRRFRTSSAAARVSTGRHHLRCCDDCLDRRIEKRLSELFCDVLCTRVKSNKIKFIVRRRRSIDDDNSIANSCSERQPLVGTFISHVTLLSLSEKKGLLWRRNVC